MFVPKYDRLRHKILHVLVSKSKAEDKRTHLAQDIAVTTEEMAKMLNTTTDEIHHAASKLQINDEVKFDDFGNGECLYAWNNSNTVYADRKYLKEGKNFVFGRIKDYLSVTVSSIAIITAIITTTTSLISLLDNHKRIKRLETIVDSLKYQKKQEPHI